MPSDARDEPAIARPSKTHQDLPVGDPLGDPHGPGAINDHDEEEDRDELDDDGEDAASSEGRARSPEMDAAPTVTELDPVSAAASEAARRTVFPNGGKTQAAFVHKVWSMVETPALQNLITWSSDGTSFLVYSPEEFARTVLPQYFKHSNFASFLRQLNFYSWSKGMSSACRCLSKLNDVLGSNPPTTKSDGTPVQAWEFRNTNFQRGRPDLLARIKRKTAKSSVGASAPPVPTRRRSSVTALSTLRAARRDAAWNGGNGDAGLAADERDGEGSRTSLRAAESAVSAPDTAAPPATIRDDYASSQRIAAGLADFAPYGGEAAAASGRAKDDNDYRPSTGRASPTYHRHPPAAPLQPNSYTAPHMYSPGTRTYNFPLSSAQSGYRSTYPEESLARQVSVLESQVRSLSDALHFSQQEFIAMRTSSYSVLQSVLSIVANLDSEGRQRDEIQAATSALARLSPEILPMFSYANPFAYSTGLAWPASHAFPSPRPSTAQSISQFYYNRIPAAESYTRTSRPDSRPDAVGPAPPANRPSTSSADAGVLTALPSPRPPSSSKLFEGSRPSPLVLPLPQSAISPPSAGPISPAIYPPPKTSWTTRPDSNGSSGPLANAVEGTGVEVKGAKPTTTLPPLSSLLNPTSGPAAPHSFADDRDPRPFDPFGDTDDRAHKKQRQQ